MKALKPINVRRWNPRRVALVVLLLGVLGIRMFGLVESYGFYFPSREMFVNPPGAIDVSFQNASGQKLHGWLLLPPGVQGKVPVVLHTHGNAGNVDSHLAFSQFLVDRGYAVFIFDYRGYGRSEKGGRLSRNALMEDTRAAFDTLLQRPEIDPTRVAVYGVSIGSVFASAIAAERTEVRAVVLAAPFSGWMRIAHTHVPFLGPLLVRSGLDPIDQCRKLGSRPLLLIHGGQDSIIPPIESERIETAAKRAGVAVTRLVVPEAGHNDIVFADQGSKDAVVAFLDRELKPRTE